MASAAAVRDTHTPSACAYFDHCPPCYGAPSLSPFLLFFSRVEVTSSGSSAADIYTLSDREKESQELTPARESELISLAQERAEYSFLWRLSPIGTIRAPAVCLPEFTYILCYSFFSLLWPFALCQHRLASILHSLNLAPFLPFFLGK